MLLLKSPQTVHVEICLSKNSIPLNVIEQKLTVPLKEYILKYYKIIPLNKAVAFTYPEEVFADYPIVSILLECESKSPKEKYLSENDVSCLELYFYYTHKRRVDLEPTLDDSQNDEIISFHHSLLPSAEYIHLWENLIYDSQLKEKLLKYALSALTFAYYRINDNIITCNRLLFLHGPPGTGKTSLCRALAQKLAIRLNQKLFNTHLVEINSHSLFSKWFSESGKLVMRMFKEIRELVCNKKNLVCVLIDEVESLAYAREKLSCQEPKDSLRVVNALLQQLDMLRRHSNVLILATSNLTDTVDNAFLDRADIKQFIGYPSEHGIRKIYESMILEMMRVGMIVKESLANEDIHEGLLSELTRRSRNLSGRSLRKIPFLAHSIYSSDPTFNIAEKIKLRDFLDAMLVAVDKRKKDYEIIARGGSSLRTSETDEDKDENEVEDDEDNEDNEDNE